MPITCRWCAEGDRSSGNQPLEPSFLTYLEDSQVGSQPGGGVWDGMGWDRWGWDGFEGWGGVGWPVRVRSSPSLSHALGGEWSLHRVQHVFGCLCIKGRSGVQPPLPRGAGVKHMCTLAPV